MVRKGEYIEDDKIVTVKFYSTSPFYIQTSYIYLILSKNGIDYNHEFYLC